MHRKIKNKKGFTLIEIIVVLVILAILVAIAIPTMFGYIEEARAAEFAQEARIGYLAAQWVVSESAMTHAGGRAEGARVAVAGLNAQQSPYWTSFMSRTDGTSGTFSNVVLEPDGVTVVGITYTTPNYIITIENRMLTTVRR
jgi:prepilin-type N-terminal cleavage/methylation domain-containing protein